MKVEDEVGFGCPKCTDPEYPNKRGWLLTVVKDDWVARRCQCLIDYQLAQKLGGRFKSIQHHNNTELFCVEHDRTKEDLFLAGSVYEIKRHIKTVLILKDRRDPAFTFMYTDDYEIKDVAVGNRQYQARPKKERDESGGEDSESTPINSLADLSGSKKLLVVELGVMEGRNKILADSILSLLRLRAAQRLPTWIVEGSSRFERGHPAYSEALAQYVDAECRYIDIGGGLDVDQEPAPAQPAPVAKPQRQYEPEPRCNGEQNFALPGADRARKSKKWED